VDNDSDMTATLVKVTQLCSGFCALGSCEFGSRGAFLNRSLPLQVDSANKYGTLLEVVQVLTDLKLTIKRAYISSDGEWFMDGEWRGLCSALLSSPFFLQCKVVSFCVG
jgi:hypothetical protein